jgi:hypothetical protein
VAKLRQWKLRHVAVIVAFAAVVVFLVEPLIFSVIVSGHTPLLGRLGYKDRVELYKQVSTVSATLMGFIITAVAILVSLDLKRQIVSELHRGEAFPLLVVNLLACVVLLFIATGLGIAGAIFDDGPDGADFFEALWQTVIGASVLELILGLSFFGLVTYKVASTK